MSLCSIPHPTQRSIPSNPLILNLSYSLIALHGATSIRDGVFSSLWLEAERVNRGAVIEMWVIFSFLENIWYLDCYLTFMVAHPRQLLPNIIFSIQRKHPWKCHAQTNCLSLLCLPDREPPDYEMSPNEFWGQFVARPTEFYFKFKETFCSCQIPSPYIWLSVKYLWSDKYFVDIIFFVRSPIPVMTFQSNTSVFSADIFVVRTNVFSFQTYIFLAVQNSSIGDLVTQSVSHSLTVLLLLTYKERP